MQHQIERKCPPPADLADDIKAEITQLVEKLNAKLDKQRTDLAEMQGQLETHQAIYNERDRAIATFKHELTERLREDKTGLLSLIEAFVKRENARRGDLEPVFPAG